MSYIIVWRNNYRSPFVDVDSRNFLEQYSTFEDAKAAAEQIQDADPKSPHYFNYQIYEEASS